ncbi:MAG: hypothetical protein ABIS50_11235 [Luteolibacter sp.]|uniref:hypothetical protein n=1 Tax=Luteolibacter sp. TaxID=1962973 RepID=UPI00326460E3
MNLSPLRRLRPRHLAHKRGFALIVTLSLMILLVVIAVGLLSLSSITLRATAGTSAGNIARANARLSLMLALGELQKAAGDDRRVTVDGSIFDGAKNPNVVGVWRSWSPNLANNPQGSAPSYASKKTTSFVSWLTSSGNPVDLTVQDWAKSGTVEKPVPLFTVASDGFSLSGAKVDVMKGKPISGAIAWSVVQDATRAKINVGGPEKNEVIPNDRLQAQARPSLAKSNNFNQPASDWNHRAGRVVSMGQAKLDTDLWKGTAATPENADFTSQGLGLLTDVVNGGLKTDLTLGFEMSDGSFQQNAWGTFKNPFRSVNVPQFTTPSNYRGQRPLFRPIVTTSGSVHVDLTFNPATTSFEFPAAAVPTFDTLRSFYRTPYHLYSTGDGPTIFERGMDHVSLRQSSGGNICPAAPPPALATQNGFRPVLDRVLYLLSLGVGADKEVRLVMTPIVTLWNPYNVALEIEGAVAYPWMDVPFSTDWTFTKNGVSEPVRGVGLSQIVGYQFLNVGHGRSVNPYFFAFITPTGSSPAAAGQSIRFKPGEVRVFAPATQTDVEFVSNNSIRKRSIALRPVDNPNQLSTRGGFAIPMKNAADAKYGFTRVMDPNPTVKDSVEVNFVPSTGSNYPFSVGLEDATRTKLANPVDSNRGQAVGDVQTVNFAQQSTVTASMKSPRYSYAELVSAATRQPFGLIETYHRVATDSLVSRRGDLVYTTNPRQPYINRYLTTGTFLAGPHYETRMRAVSTFNEVLQTNNGGRSAFYGASNSSGTGESQLSFFEVPQEPMLSLAGFQHADLSYTPYAPANQFGNSWASAYLRKGLAAERSPLTSGGSGEATYTRQEMPVYDYSYLANEALWDSFYFSGAAPVLTPDSRTGSPSAWLSDIAKVTKSSADVLADFIDDPAKHPLRNSRMRLEKGSLSASDLKADLTKPEGCLKIAAHLYVDGAFNINSTSEKAWIAFLSGMRDQEFTIRDGTAPGSGKTAFPRFRNPLGSDSNNWQGFRSLTDPQIAELAQKIIVQVKLRGPFLSMGEFVNRRIDSSNTDMPLKGAIQAAIDSTSFNQSALYDTFDTGGYPVSSKINITSPRTGVGIPGYLTQADVLQSLAPVMTARSDTFTIRGYGEAKDSAGKVLAIARCEAVVQRKAEFVDPANSPYVSVAELNSVNLAFGRKFCIVSFRYLTNNEVVSDQLP